MKYTETKGLSLGTLTMASLMQTHVCVGGCLPVRVQEYASVCVSRHLRLVEVVRDDSVIGMSALVCWGRKPQNYVY